MKKTIYLFSAILIGVIGTSCKTKTVGTTTDRKSGMEILNIPCDEFRSSTEFAFRATQSQKSSDLSLSREKALLMAKQRLASLVQAKLTSVTDRYADEYQTSTSLEMKGKFNNMTREVVSQQLNDISILCEKSVKEDDGTYTSFVAIEMKKESLKSEVTKKIGDKEKLGIDYDKMKFEQIYNEEMKKLENSK